ncbi:MAG: hypothetical protein ACP5XB_17230 [Isosphaeraceae bacterium]
MIPREDMDPEGTNPWPEPGPRRRSSTVVLIGLLLFCGIGLFVLRSLLFRRPSQRDTARFEREWREAKKQTEVPIVETDGPERFSLTFKPPTGKRFRFVFVCSEEGDSPGQEAMRMLMSGTLSMREMQGSVVIEYSEDANRFASSGMWFERTPKSRAAIYRGGKFVPAARRGDGFEPVDDGSEDPLAPLAISESVTLEFPRGSDARVGTRWTTRSPLGNTLSHEVVGFAEVAGHRTVKVRTESKLSGMTPTMMKRLKKFPLILRVMKQGTKQIETDQSDHVVSYLDLSTGQLIRLECRTEGRLRRKDCPKWEKQTPIDGAMQWIDP